ncbi:hypothetical protein RclHR1_37230001 [Rhizophagus clarus]|uniref:BAH domain-containing protein n=1 Tax=Rhizophagus clarus TaxID=94130 RepID=A0A2Z6S705_9GLOM|nr:hypothetical protein RclHR1_37230001 [Rhizophagus clarus]
MRKRYIHSTGSSVKLFQIRNWFSHTSHNETTANLTEDNNKILSKDIDMEDINRNNNESIYFQHYDNDIDLRDNVIDELSDDDDDDDDKEEDYNEEKDYYNEEGVEEKGHNDDEKEESHNDHNDEEEEEGNNNENNDIYQIIEALDKDKIPTCDVIYQSGDFVYYNDNNGHRRLGRLRAILKNDNKDYQLQIQKILNYDDLPENLKGLSRQRHSLVEEVWFVPFGGNFDEFILPFVSEIKELEKGKIMTVQGQNAWVIAGLSIITADLPQGNDLAGVLKYFDLSLFSN